MSRKKTKADPSPIENSVPPQTPLSMQNGLGDAVGMTGAGFPFNQGSPYTEQISNTNTIFKNLRWYLISNFRQVLSEMYVELGLVQTIVDVPVDDAFRGGIEITSKELDEDEIKKLQLTMDREGDLLVCAQAAKWNRLFGGAGILIMTDQDPTTELDVAAITQDSLFELRAVDMWELFWSEQNTEGYDAELQMTDYEFYDYYAKKVHVSRVMKLSGLTAPSFIRPRLRGWGFSICEKLVRSLNQYLKATDLAFEVLDEFKLDVYKIKNLVNTLMSPGGDAAIKKRVQTANWQKNYQNAVVMDSEDDFDHKQLSFSGLAEAMSGIRMQVASDMRMPLTKLFGISAAGFNSGEDDIEVYNAMVESEVRTKIKYDVLRVVELRCQKLFGFIPDDIEISFKPLRMMTSEQEENVKNAQFNRLLAAKQAGEVTSFEFREGLNRDKLLSITLDTAGDALNPDDPEIAALLAGEPKDLTEDPGLTGPSGDRKGAEGAEEEKEVPPVPAAKVTAASPPKVGNSLDYDKAAYEADGGAELFDLERLPFVKDAGLFEEMRKKAAMAYGTENLGFAVWLYKKAGGKV